MFVHMKLCLFCDIFKPFSCHVTRINDKWDVFENIKPEGGGGGQVQLGQFSYFPVGVVPRLHMWFFSGIHARTENRQWAGN